MSDNYFLYDPAIFGATEIKEDTRDAEILRLRAENEKLRAALLFAELMASEMGVDPREKCQRIYDELYKIREGERDDG